MTKVEYFPQFFARSRPYMAEFVRQILPPDGAKRAKPGLSLFYDAYLAKLAETPGGAKLITARLMREAQGGLVHGEWFRSGSIVYDFDNTLIDALERSDPGEVRPADLNFPFDTMYIAFGSEHSIAFSNGAKVTGAYVMNSPGHGLRVVLTAPQPASTPWFERYGEFFDTRILDAYWDRPLDEAIENSLRDDQADLLRALEKEASLSAGPDASREIEKLIEHIAANRDAFRKAVQLIANGLCFITAYREDIRESWQPGTPEKWITKATKGTPKEIGRARSKLSAMGYRQVLRVGEQFGRLAASSPRGGTWRRGHWRNQAYGPAFSLHRVRWIRPVAVLGGGAPESDEARVYEVPSAAHVAR
jgi:hypothetical protein